MIDESLLTRLRALPRETEWLEFKHNNTDPAQLGEYISALANGAALHEQETAYMVWGIEDETHNVVGTGFDPDIAREQNQDLPLWLARQLDPSPHFRFHRLLTNSGLWVVILQITPVRGQPVCWKNEAYIRVGSHKKKLREYPEKERRLWQQQGENSPFELEPACSFLPLAEAVARLNGAAYFAATGEPTPGTPEEMAAALTERELLIWDREANRAAPTVLGALLLARDITRFERLRSHTVRLTEYAGATNLSDRLGDEFYTAGYGVLMDTKNPDNLVTIIYNRATRRERIFLAKRQRISFGENTVREILVNALIHQSFPAHPQGIRIELYEDRLEISNDGEPLVPPARFVDAPSKTRNERLSEKMRLMNLCERKGTGFDRALKGVEELHAPAPTIEIFPGRFSENNAPHSGDGTTKVILYTPKSFPDMTQAERFAVCYWHACYQKSQRKNMTNETLRERFDLDKSAYKEESKSRILSKLLTEATRAGFLIRIPKSPGNPVDRYEPAENPPL